MGFFESIWAFLVAFCMVFTGFMDYGTPEATKEVELIKEEKMVLDAALYTGQGVTTDGEYYYTSGSLTAFGVAGLAKWDVDTFEQVAVNEKAIPYHLIDICEPGYKYNVFEYQHDFHRAYSLIQAKEKLPILCGGTGMYIEAVLKGYKLLDVPQNPSLRESLKNKSLAELETILASYKVLHNKTDVDSAQRAIRAIEIEEYYKNEAPEVNEYNPINSLIIGSLTVWHKCIIYIKQHTSISILVISLKINRICATHNFFWKKLIKYHILSLTYLISF